MNIYDAAKMLGLDGEITPPETKKRYFTLLKEYHPDINPAGLEMTKMINEAFEALKDYEGNMKKPENSANYGEEINAALNAVIDLAGLDIEICGSWVWVTGDTRTHRAVLKAAGFKYASKKKSWYFRPAGARTFSKGKLSLDEIRSKYGTSKPEFKRRAELAA